MKIKIQLLLYFITTIICNAQNNNISELLKKCNNNNNNSIKDSISIFDKYHDFTLKLPNQWTGEFKGDSPSLFANKISNSSKIWLRGYKSYDVQGNHNELKKRTPNFVGTNFIESSEIVIIKYSKIDDKSIHGYEFHCQIEKNPWTWKFYLSTFDEFTNNDICEVIFIIKQFIQKYKNKP